MKAVSSKVVSVVFVIATLVILLTTNLTSSFAQIPECENDDDCPAGQTCGFGRCKTAYMDTCEDQGVPIPPDLTIPADASDWFDLKKTNSWVFQGAVQLNLLQPGLFAGVWTYSDKDLQGACMGLPRGRNALDGGEGKLAGIICQNAKTGHACFWDNKLRSEPGPSQTPIGWRGIPLIISELHDGTSLDDNCTSCHRGNNVFLISPDDSTWAKVILGPLNGPSTGNFTSRFGGHYTPISTLTPPTQRSGWENPDPISNGCASGCHENANFARSGQPPNSFPHLVTPRKFATPPMSPGPRCADPNKVTPEFETPLNEELCYAPTDGVPAAGSLEFSVDDYPVNEDAGTVVITVMRVGGSAGEVSANFTTRDNSATDGMDYSFTDGLLTWADGDTANQTFSVVIHNDRDVEGAETVNLSLSKHFGPSDNRCNPSDPSNPSKPCDGATVGPRSTATITIAASDEMVLPLCAGHTATDFGTPGDDVLIGTDGPDVIHGLGGNDTIMGLAGDDIICAGDGNDTVRGGEGNDTVAGDNGNDTVTGGDGNDTVSGGDGNDTVRGGEGNDTVAGDNGNDTVRGGEGNDTVRGGEGNDTVAGDNGNDTVSGGDGNDVVRGGPGDDELRGGPEDDVVRGGPDEDELDGGPGNDFCGGGQDRDTVVNCERRRVVSIP